MADFTFTFKDTFRERQTEKQHFSCKLDDNLMPNIELLYGLIKLKISCIINNKFSSSNQKQTNLCHTQSIDKVLISLSLTTGTEPR